MLQGPLNIGVVIKKKMKRVNILYCFVYRTLLNAIFRTEVLSLF